MFVSFAKSLVSKYKAQRIKAVINSYVSLADGQLTSSLPIALEGYRRISHVIVDKTFENPAPAIALVQAMDLVSKHYGPALIAEFEAMSTALEDVGTSHLMTTRIKSLTDALSSLVADVRAS